MSEWFIVIKGSVQVYARDHIINGEVCNQINFNLIEKKIAHVYGGCITLLVHFYIVWL